MSNFKEGDLVTLAFSKHYSNETRKFYGHDCIFIKKVDSSHSKIRRKYTNDYIVVNDYYIKLIDMNKRQNDIEKEVELSQLYQDFQDEQDALTEKYEALRKLIEEKYKLENKP